MAVAVEGLGEVMVDISYGGAFYAFVDAQRFGLDVTKSRTRDLVDAATAVTKAVKAQVGGLSQLKKKIIIINLGLLVSSNLLFSAP